MADFEVKISGMRRNVQEEENVRKDIERIEGEIQNILNNLCINTSAVTQIKRALQTDMKSVSSVKQKMQVLVKALNEIAELCERSENKICGNTLNNSKIQREVGRLSQEVREKAEQYGIDSCSIFSGDPVNLSNGNYVYEKNCLELDTPMHLQFRIFYNIQNEVIGSLGRGWTHTYEVRLLFEKNQISMQQDDGSRMFFLKSADGEWKSKKGTFGKLTLCDSGYILQDKNQFTYFFDKEGILLKKSDDYGNYIVLTYNGDKRLWKVEDQYQNLLEFKYSKKGYLHSVSDHTGRIVNLEYKGNQVSSVQDASGRSIQYRYNEKGWLTELINAREFTGLHNEYDEEGRTICQKFPDGGIITYSYLDDINQVKLTEQNGNQIIYEHDSLYRNIRNVYVDGEELFTYDENNMRTSFTDKRGNTSHYKYDNQGNLISFRNPMNDEVRIEYTEQNQVKSVALNGMVLHSATYNDKNLQIMTENALGAKERFEYDEFGQPIAWIKADGSRVEMEYDNYGNMVSITNSMGGRTLYEYDKLHRVVRTTDALGFSTEYAYNMSDDIIRVTNSQGDSRTYEYDQCGNVIKMTDFNGSITEVEYNEINRPIKITNPDGNSTQLEYDKMWNVKRQIAPNGGVTEFEYDSLQHLSKVIDANGSVNCMEYDSCGNLIQRTDANGGIHHLGYDELNRPNYVKDPCGQEIKAEYDALGNVTRVLYEDGKDENYEYDVLGNMISTTDRSGYTKKYSYNLLGKLVAISDDAGWIEKYEYYPGGLLKSQKNMDGSMQLFQYDANENLISVTNQDGSQWRFAYDGLERVIRAENGNGIHESYEYDAVGNITAVIDGHGNRTSYIYSNVGELQAVIDAMGNETRYVYDECQRIVQILQSESGHFEAAELNSFNNNQKNIRMTNYKRDSVGNIVSVTDPEGHVTAYTYDGVGNVCSRLDADGTLTRCEFNLDGTEREFLFADGRSIKLTYNALKQLIQLEDWTGITKISSDALGRPEKVESPDGDVAVYEWGMRGERKSITYPNGQKVSYLYDNAMRLIGCANGDEQVSYSYYDNGKLKEKQFGGGFCTKYNYYPSGKVSEISHQKAGNIIEQFLYRYDKNGKKTMLQHTKQGVEENSIYEYQYNAVGNLVSVRKNGIDEENYSYDAFGNRIWSKVRGNETEYTYNRLNQLIFMYDNCGEHQYTYDKRGNLQGEYLQGKEVKRLEYGALDCLERVHMPDKKVVYEYNGFGHRIKRSYVENDGTVKKESCFFHDITKEFQNLLSIKQENSSINMLWDGGLLGEMQCGKGKYYLSDALMTPCNVLSEGSVVASMQYDAFGNLLNSSYASESTFGYTGYRMDEASGFYYANAREYSPKVGRFISKDINPGMITVPLTLNAYAYCMGDPINYYDPSGRIAAWLAGGIVGAVGNIVTKAAGDVINSVKSGKIQVSSWQSYVGTAAGGFTSGTVFIATGGNMAVAGAAGSAVETFVSDGLNMVTGVEGYRKEDGYSWKNLVGNIVVDAAKGGVAGYAIGQAGKYIKIPKINKGRGSFEAVWKQVMTKASKGTIHKIALKTLGKGLVAYGGVRFFDQILQQGIKGIKDAALDKGKEFVKNMWDKYVNPSKEHNAAAYLSGRLAGAQCPLG